MRPIARRARPIFVALAATMAAGCLATPKSEMIRQQQMIEIGDAINDFRLELATTTATLDSLRVVVAKQDSTIARLANVTGVIVVK